MAIRRKKPQSHAQEEMQRYREDIAFLESVSNITSPFFTEKRRVTKSKALSRVRDFLLIVGTPQEDTRFIHITGTSGKGSTVKILERLLRRDGYIVGTYTSPFVTANIERISVNEQFISPYELHDILETKIQPALDEYVATRHQEVPSYFEISLAIALLFFKQKRCDYVVLEAGLGGTYDATNVIDNPLVTAITTIGLDHTHILGNTRALIARDKAGIIKKGSLFLTGETRKDLIDIFKGSCAKAGAEYRELIDLTKGTDYGPYFSTPQQKQNLNLAFNILAVLGISIPPTGPALQSFRLPARQETVQKNPMVIIDGAHNADKIKNIVAFVRQQSYRTLHLVVGMAADKRYASTLKPLLELPNIEHIYLTRFLVTVRKAASLQALHEVCRKYFSGKICLHFSPHDALMAALKNAHKDDLILITGSFFLAGELRKHWIPEKEILSSLSAF